MEQSHGASARARRACLSCHCRCSTSCCSVQSNMLTLAGWRVPAPPAPAAEEGPALPADTRRQRSAAVHPSQQQLLHWAASPVRP